MDDVPSQRTPLEDAGLPPAPLGVGRSGGGDWIARPQFGEQGEIRVPGEQFLYAVGDTDRCDTCIVDDRPPNPRSLNEVSQEFYEVFCFAEQ